MRLAARAVSRDVVFSRVNPRPLVLASTSSYRRALLERLGLPFAVMAPEVDEQARPTETAEHTALRLAESKARAVAPRTAPNALIVGSDQVALLDHILLGKPGNHSAATAQLRAMRGREVVFYTAVCLYDAVTGGIQLASVPTTVVFRRLSDAQIERYLSFDQPYDCAGSARIEGLGITLVESVASSDPSALIGLPLIELTSMLTNAGIEIP